MPHRRAHLIAHRMVHLVFVALATTLASAELRAVASDVTGRDIAAACASCHRDDAPPGAAIPPLRRDAAAIVRQVRDFRSGTRPSTVMQQLAKGYSDADIAAAAAYLAARPASAPTKKPPG
jgi:sulfide dehydrogenase cytochrome subunit